MNLLLSNLKYMYSSGLSFAAIVVWELAGKHSRKTHFQNTQTYIIFPLNFPTTLDSSFHRYVALELLTAVTRKITVYWDVTPCCLINMYRRFKENLWIITEAGGSSETFVRIHQTVRHHRPENDLIHNHKTYLQHDASVTLRQHAFYVGSSS
jgi:hypothetical protein